MKLVLAIPYNPLEEIGGLEISTLRLAGALKSLGQEVRIIRCGKLPSEYQRFSNIFDEAKLVESFPIFLDKNRINLSDQ